MNNDERRKIKGNSSDNKIIFELASNIVLQSGNHIGQQQSVQNH